MWSLSFALGSLSCGGHQLVGFGKLLAPFL
jgi:hypothetical protein